MTDFLLLCIIFGWNPFSIIFKVILFFGIFWLITRKEFRITIGVIALIALICFQPRILIVIAIVAIIYKLCNLTANQKASITKVKNSITNPISKFFKAHGKDIIYSICLLVFFIILFSILGSLSPNNEDNKTNTKNQIINTDSYNSKEIVNNIIGSGEKIEENLKIEEDKEVEQKPQETKLYDTKTTTTTYTPTYTPTYTSNYSSNSNRTSSKSYYDWDDDPEISEFYEYDNFDDYYDNYGSYYDDYSYDELKDMYDDERGNDRPYEEYGDYYDDIWYDYYGGYGGYDNHYDDYVDEYGYED